MHRISYRNIYINFSGQTITQSGRTPFTDFVLFDDKQSFSQYNVSSVTYKPCNCKTLLYL